MYPVSAIGAQLPGFQYVNATVIPISAILYEDGKSYIFEVVEDHIVKKPVTLIERHNDLHIIEGIDPGVVIVNKDVSGLADGQTVYVR